MLINKSLANKEVATEFGVIQFNDKGESKDLKADQEKKLAELPGFELKSAAAKPAAKKEEDKEDEKPAAKKQAKK